jgi:hypothetical protein
MPRAGRMLEGGHRRANEFAASRQRPHEVRLRGLSGVVRMPRRRGGSPGVQNNLPQQFWGRSRDIERVGALLGPRRTPPGPAHTRANEFAATTTRSPPARTLRCGQDATPARRIAGRKETTSPSSFGGGRELSSGWGRGRNPASATDVLPLSPRQFCGGEGAGGWGTTTASPPPPSAEPAATPARAAPGRGRRRSCRAGRGATGWRRLRSRSRSWP